MTELCRPFRPCGGIRSYSSRAIRSPRLVGTKAGRAPNDGFAWGAANAFLAHRSCSRHRPGRRLRIYNRGVSGDKVTTMAGRWEKDTIALKPDFITILVA